MVRMYIEVENMKGAMMRLNKLRKTLPRAVITGHNRTAEILKKNLKIEAPVWKGTLVNNISTKREGKDVIKVTMPYYAEWLEKGMIPTFSTTADLDRLKQWSKEKPGWYAYRYVLNRLTTKGINRNAFITRGFRRSIPEIEAEIAKIGTTALRDAGYR